MVISYQKMIISFLDRVAYLSNCSGDGRSQEVRPRINGGQFPKTLKFLQQSFSFLIKIQIKLVTYFTLLINFNEKYKTS